MSKVINVFRTVLNSMIEGREMRINKQIQKYLLVYRKNI